MSRFDYRDPGQDPLYTDGLEPADMDEPESPAADIAAAITLKCDAHLSGEIDRLTWEAEQFHLWKRAADLNCAAEVMRLVAPSLTMKERAS